MAEEILPFGVRGDAIFLARPQTSATSQESQVRLDGLLRIDGLWPRVTLMSRCPAITWAIWGGIPLRMASVMNSLRKSWGV